MYLGIERAPAGRVTDLGSRDGFDPQFALEEGSRHLTRYPHSDDFLASA